MTSPAHFRAPQLEILDLRHFAGKTLRPVLEAENRVWGDRLHWDYRASTNLLLQYLDARVLPGFVAVENGRVIGYTFCVYEERKAVIGDVFAEEGVSRSFSAEQIEAKLLDHLISLLQNSPGVERIESQLLLHIHPLHTELFNSSAFSVYRRVFMDLDLQATRYAQVKTEALAALGLELRSWHENDFNLAGPLIAHAYEGHLDSTINDQYRSVAGSLRFLHNIIRFPGCGVFDKQASHVLVHRATGALAGLILCSKVRDDVQHITQLCVASRARGAGLGALLLQVAAVSLARRGFGRISLTVTSGNDRAAGLYTRAGFREQHSFNAMVWTNPRSGGAKPKAPVLQPPSLA